MVARYELYTDGGSRGNPGLAACAFVVVETATQKIIHEANKTLGIATNNEAEYQGFIESVNWVLDQKWENETLIWKLDSLLVVQQLNSIWKIKDARMRVFAQTAWEKLKRLTSPYTIQHIPREQNSRADALLNQALDLLS